MKNILATLIAASALAGLSLTGAEAAGKQPFAGVVLVAATQPSIYTLDDVVISPASASPMAQEQASAIPNPGFKRGKIVPYSGKSKAGDIVINTKTKRLYYVLGSGYAVQYQVATAKKGFEWSGTHKVSAKTTWPDWRPPAEMRKRKPELPVFMEGGPENPLGARAIYLGSSIYRIHGTNEPASIGKAASSGCIRMLNEDVSELYKFVKKGATVTVL
jgi:lipoprotein-anchoring transpeptidase ErfK/SrfK